MGLCECERATQDLLMGDPRTSAEGKDPAVAGKKQQPTFGDRESHDYLVLRGNEQASVLLGVRTAVADSMELLMWDRKFEGTYKAKTKQKTLMRAYTRTLMAKIALKHQVGYMGKEMRVAVCHLHFQVANKNKKFRKNNDEFWPWLASKLKEHKVQVLMGDFNMSLFKVVPELRSRGVPIQLTAWYPWRERDTNRPMADSCGIFMCVPAIVSPKVNMNWFDEAWWTLRDHEENGGPGQTLYTYLPKAQELEDKLQSSFEPLEPAVAGTDDAVVAKGKGKGKSKTKSKATPSQRMGLTVREKRLDAETWEWRGKFHKGAHFPLAAFTNNVGRRSEERYIARKARGW